MAGHRRRVLAAIAAVSALLISPAATAAAEPATTIFVVRHAEKVESTQKDPPLTEAGEARARALLHALKDTGVTAVYASQFKRTLQTVTPLASALGLDVQQVDARDTAALVNRVLHDDRGGTIVICGHSNTVPDIITALGGEAVKPLTERDYDNLYMVVREGDGSARVILLNYGRPDGTP